MRSIAIGFGLGFLVALQLGPMSLFLVRSTLRGGPAAGLGVGLGIATVDGEPSLCADRSADGSADPPQPAQASVAHTAPQTHALHPRTGSPSCAPEPRPNRRARAEAARDYRETVAGRSTRAAIQPMSAAVSSGVPSGCIT